MGAIKRHALPIVEKVIDSDRCWVRPSYFLVLHSAVRFKENGAEHIGETCYRWLLSVDAKCSSGLSNDHYTKLLHDRGGDSGQGVIAHDAHGEPFPKKDGGHADENTHAARTALIFLHTRSLVALTSIFVSQDHTI